MKYFNIIFLRLCVFALSETEQNSVTDMLRRISWKSLIENLSQTQKYFFFLLFKTMK